MLPSEALLQKDLSYIDSPFVCNIAININQKPHKGS